MANKKAFSLRIDEATYKALEKWAADEFRSLNGQIEFLLHEALINVGREPRRRNLKDHSEEENNKN